MRWYTVPFLMVAVIGLVISILCHGVSYGCLGFDLQEKFPRLWLLHLGVFVVWIPLVLLSNRATDGARKKDLWQHAMRRWPRWAKGLAGAAVVYVFINFFFLIFVLKEGGGPAGDYGHRTLKSHGRVIRSLTEEEYRRQRDYDVRLFSGHWMLFYGASVIVFASMIGRPNDGSSANVK